MEATVKVENAELNIDDKGNITPKCGKIVEIIVERRKLPVRQSLDLGDIPRVLALLTDLNEFLLLLPEVENGNTEKVEKKPAPKKEKYVPPKVDVPPKVIIQLPKGNRIAKVFDCYIYEGVAREIVKFMTMGSKVRKADIENHVDEIFGVKRQSCYYHMRYLIETGFVERGYGWFKKKGRSAKELTEEGLPEYPNLLEEDGRKKIDPKLLRQLENKFSIRIKREKKGKKGKRVKKDSVIEGR